MQIKIKQRILSWVLTISILVTTMPAISLAADTINGAAKLYISALTLSGAASNATITYKIDSEGETAASTAPTLDWMVIDEDNADTFDPTSGESTGADNFSSLTEGQTGTINSFNLAITDFFKSVLFICLV